MVLVVALVAAACSGATAATHPGHRAAAAAKSATTSTSGVGTGDTGSGNTGSGTSTTSVTVTTVPVPGIAPAGRHRNHAAGPVIAKFSPLSSPSGTVVTIVGKRLLRAVQVSFDGIPAAISSNGATTIRAVVPVGATSGPITVVTPYGSATVSGFTVT